MEKNFNDPPKKNPENPRANLENQLQEYLTDPNSSPIHFSLHLDKSGATAKDYEKLIPILENQTLPLTPLVEDNQLLMRGDSVERVNQRVINFENPVAMGMIRTRKMDMSGKNKNLFIVGSIMEAVKERNRTAFGYRKDNLREGGKKTKPVIIYAFSKYPRNGNEDSRRSGANNENLFYGGADDMGSDVNNNYFLELPEYSRPGPADKLLPHIIPGQQAELSTAQEQRWENITNQFMDSDGDINTDLPNYLILPKTYFNLEIITHRILTDLKAYSKEQA